MVCLFRQKDYLPKMRVCCQSSPTKAEVVSFICPTFSAAITERWQPFRVTPTASQLICELRVNGGLRVSFFQYGACLKRKYKNETGAEESCCFPQLLCNTWTQQGETFFPSANQEHDEVSWLLWPFLSTCCGALEVPLSDSSQYPSVQKASAPSLALRTLQKGKTHLPQNLLPLQKRGFPLVSELSMEAIQGSWKTSIAALFWFFNVCKIISHGDSVIPS